MSKPSFLKRMYLDQRGATAVEYGLICAMIVIAMIAALQGVATSTSAQWNMINSKTAAVTASVNG